MLRSKADSQAAYERFIKRVIKNKVVWIIVMVEHDYPFYCQAYERDTDVFPFWSDKAYAKQCQKSFDFETEIDTIQLANFIEITLPMLIENEFLAGPNWNRDLAGKEVEPTELLSKLNEAIAQK